MHRSLLYWSLAIFLVLCGALFRFQLHHPTEVEPGYDEKIYVAYVDRLNERGLASYPTIFTDYIEQVSKAEFVFLPPSRAGYIVPAWALTKLSKWDSYEALRLVSAAGSWLFMLAGFLFARRWLTPRMALAVLGFLACDPLQIQLSQYAFIDSNAALWTLLAAACLWESFREPKRIAWAIGAGIAAWALVVTKQEIAAFVALSFGCIFLFAKRLRLTEDRRPSFFALTAAGVLGTLTLILIAGGTMPFFETFRIYSERSQTLPYAIATGDGPWHRYLLEILLVNPFLFLFALAGIFRRQSADILGKYWLLFLVSTYVIMCNVRYGMNLRYTAMWDFPLALFAVMAISSLTTRLRRPTLWAAVLTAVVCYTSFRQYAIVFHDLYDADPRFMLRNVQILK
jgi:4-amino-4-deoxy-L-arabinose transferase-like glycosyltransferase